MEVSAAFIKDGVDAAAAHLPHDVGDCVHYRFGLSKSIAWEKSMIWRVLSDYLCLSIDKSNDFFCPVDHECASV